jgi:Tol biopolymer transport system component/DNA-binding winged helix-turn-helix (wHTH) protein
VLPPRSSAAIVRFGEFEADLQNSELRKRGVRIALQEQPFRVLALLLESPGELVTRQVLREALWPDNTFVDFERSLNTAVAKLRQGLGDSAENPRFIARVTRRGYRFVASVEKVKASDELSEHSALPFDYVHVSACDGADPRAEEEKFFPKGLRRPRLLFVIASIGLIFTAFLTVTVWTLLHRNTHFDRMHVRRLTSNGQTITAAVSPDARYVVYAVAVDGRQSLWLRQTAISSAVEIVPPEEVVYSGLAFSHDGSLIYCSRYDKRQPTYGALYEIGNLGGHFRKLLSGIAGPVAVSPDGARLAFVRWNIPAGQTYLMLSNADGTNEERLATRRLNRAFQQGAAWSSDGTLIAVGAAEDQWRYSVVLLPVLGGRERVIANREWTRVKHLAWMPDGKSLIVAAADMASLDTQLWRIAYPDDEVHRVTNDSSDYEGVSLTANGESLVTVARAAPYSIWVTALNDTSPARKLIAGTSDYDWVLGLDWTPDGRVIYSSKSGGSVDVWTVARDGGTPRQLVLPSDFVPWTAIASNGTMVFASGHQSNLNVWMANMNGSNVRQLTQDGSSGCPDISPDGETVVYGVAGSGLWRVAIRGDNPTLLARKIMCFPRISPDGRLVAYSYLDDEFQTPKVAVIPLSGGAPIVKLNIPWDPTSVCMCKRVLQWAPDGQAITYTDTHGGVSNIWSQPLDGSLPAQLTHFTTDHIFAFAWSKTGDRLALSRGLQTADAILLSGFDR